MPRQNARAITSSPSSSASAAATAKLVSAGSNQLDVSPSQSLAQQAYACLRDAIEEGTIEPGRRLLEVQVSDWLQISRTPVREALRRLQTEGLLEHGPNGGLMVAIHDAVAVSELYDVREALEGTAAAMAARNANQTDIEVLRAHVRAQQALPADAHIHARENKLFHECLYAAAHNRFLLKSVQALQDAMALLGRTNFAAHGRIESSIEEHRAITEAIAARDPMKAEEAARRHIRSGYQSRVRAMTDDLHAAALDRSRLGAGEPTTSPGYAPRR